MPLLERRLGIGDRRAWPFSCSENLLKRVFQQADKLYDEVAIAWLSVSGPANTFPFGTQGGSEVFFEKLVEEIEEFLCGKDYYIEDRKKLLTGAEATKTVVISSISLAIAPVVHASAPYIAPVVALVLITVAKLGRNAWCAMRREQKSDLHKDVEQ